MNEPLIVLLDDRTFPYRSVRDSEEDRMHIDWRLFVPSVIQQAWPGMTRAERIEVFRAANERCAREAPALLAELLRKVPP